ncbi:MAG: DUF2270 domain-containing protein [Acidobacteriota bacterium]
MSDHSAQPPGAFEAYPLTRTEYISAMVHFYRGELTRANSWRIRLDTSTNWAIIASIGLLSFAFGTPEHSHASIVLGMLLVLHFLALEARRYRFFDLFRYRLRMVEENFYGPLLSRDLHSPESNWGRLMAGHLFKPEFKITYLQAFRARFASNYVALFFILLSAWVSKLIIHGGEGKSFLERLSIGPIPWYVSLSLVGGVYIFLLAVLVFVSKVTHPDLEYVSRIDRPEDRPDF